MKMQRMFRTSLFLGWMAAMLWIIVIPVKAEKIEEAVSNQAVETKLQEEETIWDENITGLDDEFTALEEESVIIVEEVERYRKEEKRKGIQKAVVIMLSISILGVGIATGLQEKEKKI